MAPTSLKKEAKQSERSSREMLTRSRNKRKKRKLSCSSAEEILTRSKCKRQKKQSPDDYLYDSLCDHRNSFCDLPHNDRLVIEWNKIKPIASRYRKRFDRHFRNRPPASEQNACAPSGPSDVQPHCWMDNLPEEILLKIFSYLPLGMLLHTVPQVCRKWEILALDWTLWKTVEDLTIKNMVISTAKLRSLLRTIPKLKKLELILRNDTEELLHELFETHQNLEVLKLDRCYRSTLQMNILSQTVTSILELCPKLKTVMLTDTYFHSKNFYKCLAKKFRTIERINVTCTTKSEMDVFMENLKENVPEVEFQRVPMMGRAGGKQIYWGPILGLVVRPIPTSPFHQQYIHDNYPNYAF